MCSHFSFFLLSQRNSWYCPKCKEHVRALKTLNVWSLPKVLIVHLKRFCVNDDDTVAAANRKLGGYALQQRSKLHHLVSFPLDGLDPSPCLAENAERTNPPVLYDCFAVINHMGSLVGGHYTALARSWGEAAPGKSGSWCVACARAPFRHQRLALTSPPASFLSLSLRARACPFPLPPAGMSSTTSA